MHRLAPGTDGLIRLAVGILPSWLGMCAAAVLPGLAVTTALRRSTNLEHSERLLLGMALSPLVVIVLFYGLRLASLSVAATSYAVLAFAGLSAGAFVWDTYRHGGSLRLPPLGVCLAALPGLALHLWLFGDPQVRANQGHVWMHADPTYAFLQGRLLPEETLLAGVRIGYPFLPYTYQAVLSSLRDQSPVFSYIWAQLLSYLVVVGLAERVLARLGVSLRGRIFGVLWLSFGINPLGYSLRHSLPEPMAALDVWGEIRYSPWMQKYLQASHMPYAQTAFVGCVLLVLSPLRDLDRWGSMVLLCLLVLTVGATYRSEFLPGDDERGSGDGR